MTYLSYQVQKTIVPYYSILLLIGCACNSQNQYGQDRNSSEIATTADCSSHYALLHGTWQSANFWDAYTEIEIADSIRCYVNHGDYVGPTTAEEYWINKDTLIRKETGQKYHLCFKDSSTVLLTSPLGPAYTLERLHNVLKISDCSLGQDSMFDAEFLHRMQAFKQ
ncbi:MAG: hypothetical protein Salg2KO_14770 [Salibacteraceae bacterium]